MKASLDIAILSALSLCQVVALAALGGILQDYALPLYASVTLLALLWMAKLWLTKETSWISSPLHLPVLAFALYAIVQYFRSPLEYESRLELLQIGICILVYFIAAANLHRPRDRTTILTVLVILAFAESFYALWQFTMKQDVVLWLDRAETYHGRGSGTFFCPNHLAGFLVMLIVMLVAHTLIRRSHCTSFEKLVVQKLTEGYLVLFLIAGLWSTMSRGGWLSLIVSLVAFLLWAESFHILTSRFLLICFSILVALGITAYSVPSVRHRIHEAIAINWEYTYETSAINKADVSGREPMWKPTLQIIRDHPALGTGPGTWQWVFPKYRDRSFQIHPQFTHSDPLQLTSDYGFIGLALVLIAFGCFFWQAARASTPANPPDVQAFAAGSAAAIVAVLVHSLGDFNMHIPANALLAVTFIGLTAAIETPGRWGARRTMKPLAQIILGFFVLLIGALIGWFGIRTSLAARAVQTAEEPKQLHQWDAAVSACQRAIHYDPRSPAAYAQLGDTYRQQSLSLDESAPDAEQYRLAKLSIEAYQQSLQLNPYQVEALLRLAVAYELNDDDNRALDAYYQALTADPNNAFVHLRLGIFSLRIGDTDRAIQAFRKTVELNPQDQIAADYLKKISGK